MSNQGVIGVLALQGDFAAHGKMLERLGWRWRPIRLPAELEPLAGLIMPGGESTTLLKLMEAVQFEPALKRFYERGRPIFATCAGLIVLAAEVTNPVQRSLGLLDVAVERNSYGRQVDSFEAYGEWLGERAGQRLEMVFIRAPRIVRVGPSVELLARCGDDPVLVRDRHVLAATFHPELTSDLSVHELFVDLCRSSLKGVAAGT